MSFRIPVGVLNAWMLTRIDQLVEQMDRRLGGWHLGDAAEMLRGAFWGEFCDTYLEAIKVPELAAFLTLAKAFSPPTAAARPITALAPMPASCSCAPRR